MFPALRTGYRPSLTPVRKLTGPLPSTVTHHTLGSKGEESQSPRAYFDCSEIPPSAAKGGSLLLRLQRLQILRRHLLFECIRILHPLLQQRTHRPSEIGRR